MDETQTAQMLVKITQPRLGKVYPRIRLFQAIDDARQRPIIWISAPPGAGKTTLVASYLADRNIKSLWYQVDEGDTDVASFFYYMGLAAKKAAPRRKKSLPLFTPEYALGLPVFTRRYFEKLYSWLKPPYVLVLDNYQTVPADATFHEIIQSGLSLLPAGVQAIIISREEPPAAFARLRANQNVQLIEWGALKLDDTEFNEIIQLKDRTLPEVDELAQLRQRTGGWMAGLLLLLESTANNNVVEGSGGHLLENQSPQVVFDYFATEILERQDVVTREFLLQIALLPRTTSHMANRLTGVLQPEKILQQLHRNRYFIECHAHNDVYQLHPLFREFLLSQLKLDYSEVDLMRLQHRAAQVLEESEQIEEAVSLYLAAGDWAETTRLTCEHAQTLISQGRGETVTQWVKLIPGAITEETPWLQFWAAASRMMIAPLEGQVHLEKAFWQFKKQSDLPGMCLSLASIVDTFSFAWDNFYPLDDWIEELEPLLAECSELPSPEIQAKITAAMFASLMLRRPDHPNMERYTKLTREIMRNVPSANQRVIMGMQMATYYVWYGRHREMELLLDELRLLLEREEITPMGFITFRAMEAMYYTRSETGDSVKAALDGLQRAEQSGVYVINPLLLGFAAIGSMNAGNLEAAKEYLARSAALFHPDRLMDQAQYHWSRGHLAWLQDDVPSACNHARECLALATRVGSVFHDQLTPLTLAKILVEAGDYREAGEIFDKILSSIRDVKNPTLEYECLLAMAKSAFDQQDERAGLAHLRAALTIMRRIGSVTTIWWNPKWITPLFARALEADIEVDYVRSLIRKHHLLPDEEQSGNAAWPWRVKIHTLGGFSLSVDDKPAPAVGKGQKKPVELLKALVAFGGNKVSETHITDSLWPDADGDDARHSLKTTVHRLRKLLGNDEAIMVQAGHLSLNPRYCWTDVRAFESALEENNNIALAGDGDGRSAMLERAIQLYKGPFLAGEGDTSWALAPGERLRNRYLRAVEELGTYREQDGEWEQAVTCYETGISADELAEPFYQRLIVCHAQTGRHAEALATYERYRKLLAARFGIEPSEKTRQMIQAIKGG